MRDNAALRFFEALSSWHDKGREDMKDKRVETVSQETERVKDKILLLAEAYRAEGLLLRELPRKKFRYR